MKKLNRNSFEKYIKLNKENCIKSNSAQGITLIALIVTIVVMIIVAGVTINMTVGENGIFAKAVKAKEMQEVAEVKERLELKQLDARLSLGGKSMTLENYLKYLVDQGMIDESDIEDTADSNTKTILVDNQYIYTVREKEDGTIELEYEGKAGKLLPKIKSVSTKVTTSSIEVKVDATRVDGGEYRFYIKDVTSGEDYKKKETNKTGEYTFTGLEQNKEFKVKVEVENKNGIAEKETNIIRTVTVAELTQADLEFTYNPNDWTKDKIVVTVNAKIEIPEGYTLQTSKDMTNWDNTTTQEFTENGYMYVRLYDGINGGKYAVGEVTKIDKDAPTNVTITAGNVNNKIIILTANGKDSASKIKEYQFYVDGKLEKTVTTTEESTTYNYTSTFGEHTGYVVVVDKAENKTTSSTINFSDYTIKTAQEMVTFRNSVNKGTTYEGKTVTLLNDIDLSSICSASIGSWEPIGTSTNRFSGTFVGNNNTIDKLYIDSSNDRQGLFGSIYGADISGIVIGINSSVKGNKYVGGIVGHSKNSEVSNCGNNAKIEASDGTAGGIAGCSIDGNDINNCYNKGVVIVSQQEAGGIIGYNRLATVKYCYNTGYIKGEFYIGGIVGSGAAETKIYNSYNSGKVETTDNTTNGFVGGISARLRNKGVISHCYNTGEIVSNVKQWTGGIVGHNSAYNGTEHLEELKSVVEYSYNKANVTAIGRYTGGIVGNNSAYSNVNNCYILDTIKVMQGTTQASNDVGTSSVSVGKIIGINEGGTYENIGALNTSNMPTVYKVVNGLNDGSSEIWSNSDVNTPKLKWEK